MPFRPTRLALALIPCLLVGAFTSAAFAEGEKPLRIVVPFAAGGSQDVIARYLGSKIGSRLGVPVIVENKAGAGGIVAADYVSKATDGATLLMATGGAVTIAPHLQKLPYDPRQDLQSVALVADTPMTLAVRSDSPYKTLADLLKDARARPDMLSYASTGNGSISHLTGALLAQASGTRILHIPYRGASPALTDLLGGQVTMIVTSAASIDPMVESGKARVLGTFSKDRLTQLGHPPTVGEATGLKGLDVPVWVGLMGPTRVPPEHLDAIVAAVLEACRQPETRAQFARLGAVNTCGDKAAMEKVVSQDDARWDRVIKTGGIKIE